LARGGVALARRVLILSRPFRFMVRRPIRYHRLVVDTAEFVTRLLSSLSISCHTERTILLLNQVPLLLALRILHCYDALT